MFFLFLFFLNLYRIDGNKTKEEVQTQVDSIFKITINLFNGIVPRILFVIGMTGSGKTKQCEYIVNTYGYAVINQHSLIQDESKLNTENGKQCKKSLTDGSDVDPSIVIQLLQKKMELFIKLGQTRFLLDDFPTSIELLNEWNKVMCYSTEVIGHIYFDCKKETIIGRQMKLNIKKEVIEKRTKYFEDKTKKVLDTFKKDNLLQTIDSNKESKEISNQIDEIFTNKYYDFPGGMPNVLFIMGGPGTGKTSVCKYIESNFGFEHLCVGDLLKEEAANPDKNNDSKTIKKILDEGGVVPVNITLSLIRKKMIKIAANGNLRILIDGFPRNTENYMGWNKEMSGSTILIGSILLECNDKMTLMRLVEKDKKEGKGDTTALIKKRLTTYNKETIPLIRVFEEKGICFKYEYILYELFYGFFFNIFIYLLIE